MRRILVDLIKGHELLARDIVSERGIVIMSIGTTVKKEYINKLKELGIEYICVEDELSEGVCDKDIIEILIQDQCQSAVRDIIEKYSYQENSELEEIKGIAEDIIRDILKQPEVMFSISDIRDKNERAYSHSVNVCGLSVLLALRLNIPKNKVREIAIGSLLHDIGYNSIPFDYMNGSFDECTKEEQIELMKHVVFGYTTVIKEEWLSLASKDIILCHHERVDGSGYPFHKKGERIKIGSKIVAVCDEFDNKVYGFLEPKKKVHETINYINSCSGVKFDPEVVNCFMESVGSYPNGAGVITNEGETGIVLRQNHKYPTRPVLHMITDKNGKNYTNWVVKDLKKELKISIWDTIEI